MADVLSEFCAEGFDKVPAALAAGARRVELCANLAEGGTTPATAVIKKTVDYAAVHHVGVMSMIRTRPGDFVYTDAELTCMEAEIEQALDQGVLGVVFGCLQSQGASYVLDRAALDRLVSCARRQRQAEITFHMAFDALDPSYQLIALDELAAYGITRVLTHGGPAHTRIEQNIDHLKTLVAHADHRIGILPGAGITWRNASEIAQAVGVFEVHGTKIVRY